MVVISRPKKIEFYKYNSSLNEKQKVTWSTTDGDFKRKPAFCQSTNRLLIVVKDADQLRIMFLDHNYNKTNWKRFSSNVNSEANIDCVGIGDKFYITYSRLESDRYIYLAKFNEDGSKVFIDQKKIQLNKSTSRSRRIFGISNYPSVSNRFLIYFSTIVINILKFF